MPHQHMIPHVTRGEALGAAPEPGKGSSEAWLMGLTVNLAQPRCGIVCTPQELALLLDHAWRAGGYRVLHARDNAKFGGTEVLLHRLPVSQAGGGGGATEAASSSGRAAAATCDLSRQKYLERLRQHTRSARHERAPC